MRLAALFILSASILPAHEIGTTRVAAVFHPDRTYTIDVVTDAAALADKLGVSPASLAEADAKFRQRVKVDFGSGPVTPVIAYTGTGIRLTGLIPPGARTFTWTYGWTFASYALTVPAEGITQWLEGGQQSAPIPLAAVAQPTRLEVFWRYLALGFTHIVPHGLDHMLFVLGIYLLSGRTRAVLLQVSAFTVAHSITLGLSLYGVVSVPSRIVEPMIAVSIAYVAIENLFVTGLKAHRVALVFVFGLLHGMGFAGVLKELGLPHGEFLTGLLSFNAGVETGQLAVIATAIILVGKYRARIVVPASAAIACTALYWTVTRL